MKHKIKNMTDTEYKLIEAQIGGLQALFQANFEVMNESQKEMIKHQKITNGRINGLERYKDHDTVLHDKLGEQLLNISNIFKEHETKGLNFWLWFSEKKYRLAIALIPFYLFTIKEVRDFTIEHISLLFKLIL